MKVGVKSNFGRLATIFVRWMLTSSFKYFKCAKIFKCQFTKQLLGYLRYSTFFVLLLNFLTYLAETIVLYSLILVSFLLTICVDAEKPIQGASIKICICTPQKYIREDMDVHRSKSNRNSYLLLLSKASRFPLFPSFSEY